MKYLDEYRNAEATRKVIAQIGEEVSGRWNIMEVCGGQTHSLIKNGLLDLLPEQVRMIHGPGCPVCVTPVSLIDKAIALLERGAIVCSFGDMVRVPGSNGSLLEAKAQGGDLRLLYSPLEAVNIAQDNPEKEVVFFAVGFETTAPANALAVLQAEKRDLSNFYLLVSHVLVPPAMEAILDDPFCQVNAFLGAGNVCTVMGYWQYHELAQKYGVPIVITGFEPLDLAQGILRAVQQLEAGTAKVENQYDRVVSEQGNQQAQKMIETVFETGAREWRGIGTIPQSGYVLRPAYQRYDADSRFSLSDAPTALETGCMAGDILKGKMKPAECPHFGHACNPANPLGAPMVSSEGACAAYYHYADHQ